MIIIIIIITINMSWAAQEIHREPHELGCAEAFGNQAGHNAQPLNYRAAGGSRVSAGLSAAFT